jgi:hypothetical protein
LYCVSVHAYPREKHIILIELNQECLSKEINYYKIDLTICYKLLDELNPDFEFEPSVRFVGSDQFGNSLVNKLLNPVVVLCHCLTKMLK